MTRIRAEGLPAAVLALALGAGCTVDAPSPETAGPRPYDPASATAMILVRATARGSLPKMRAIRFDGDAEAASQNPSPVLEQTIVASDGRLANVVAWISKGAGRWTFEAPQEEAALDIVRCMYAPHVLTLRAGQALRVSNLGTCTHNVHVVPASGPEINLALRKGDPPLRCTFPAEETGFPVRDDVHGWMKAWIGVFSHPFHGVTGADGSVSIKVPAGDYEVSAWHEYAKFAKPAPQKVTLAAGETKEVEFVYEVAK